MVLEPFSTAIHSRAQTILTDIRRCRKASSRSVKQKFWIGWDVSPPPLRKLPTARSGWYIADCGRRKWAAASIRPGAANGTIQFILRWLKSPAVDAVYLRTGSYLLPQAYPEGCPLHPSYPAGHAAIAGACSVILKVCFDESMLLPGCVVPSSDGLSLEPCSGFAPTIGDEVNKLSCNIALARDWAGIHYRSDCMRALSWEKMSRSRFCRISFALTPKESKV